MKPDAAASRKVVRPQVSMIIAAVFFWVCVPVNGVCKRLQFTIKLADVTINIDHRYPYIYQACRTFEIPLSKEPDFTVSATDERIRNEFEAWEEIFHCTLDFDRWKGRCESDSLITSICDRMPFYDMFLMHAAVVAVDGVAYIFTAPSGTGKTTHTMLWKKHFGDRAVIVNGDKPLIRLQDGKVYVCSTPWEGQGRAGPGARGDVPGGGHLHHRAKPRKPYPQALGQRSQPAYFPAGASLPEQRGDLYPFLALAGPDDDVGGFLPAAMQPRAGGVAAVVSDHEEETEC